MAKKLNAPEGYYTKDEKKYLLEGLTPADVLRIKKVAHYLSGRGQTGDDLIQEATRRILADIRNWKKSMRTVPFLISTMRSIADAGFKKKSAENAVKYSLDEEGVEEPAPAVDERSRLTPEDRMIHAEGQKHIEQVMSEIWCLFKDDPEATQVLQGQFAGLSVPDVCTRAGMNSVQYNTARRRIRRTLDKKYPNGWRVS